MYNMMVLWPQKVIQKTSKHCGIGRKEDNIKSTIKCIWCYFKAHSFIISLKFLSLREMGVLTLPCLMLKGVFAKNERDRKQINLIPNKSFRYYKQCHRLFFDTFVNSWYFIIFCIFDDLRVTFENIYSCFEDFW